MEPEQECPICMEAYGPERPRCAPADGSATRCQHGFCEPCGFEILRHPPREWRCPVCRADIADWMADEFCWIPGQEQGVSVEVIATYVERTLRLLEASGGHPELVSLARQILPHTRPETS